MAKKEHKSRLLNNEEVERGNKIKGKNVNGSAGYTGTQDTGEDKIRGLSSETQKKDRWKDDLEQNEMN
jgi:hypothetical protein